MAPLGRSSLRLIMFGGGSMGWGRWQRVVPAVALALTFACSTAQAGWDEGIAAYGRKDWSSAAFEFEPLARSGHAGAALRMAILYQNGWGVPKDEAQAFSLMKVAAEKDDATAQNNLGGYHMRGIGTPRNQDQALLWYGRAAAQGQPNALNNLGAIYFSGIGVLKDEAKGVAYFQKAAEKGIVASWEFLGIALWDGRGVAQDRTQAVVWLRKAAERGMMVAQNRLGAALWNGDGADRDLVQAVQWFERSALQGDAGSLYNVGQAYWLGQGVDKDPAKAVLYLILAAKRAKPADAARFAEARDKVRAQIPADEWGKADYRARDWTPTAAQVIDGNGAPIPPALSSPMPPSSATSPVKPPESVPPGLAGRPQKTAGSGIVVSGAGDVLTNSHVVEQCRTIKVTVEGQPAQAAVVVGRDAVNDLALLKASFRPAEVARFREDKPMRSGDTVVVVGYPLSSVLSVEPNVTAGLISAMAGLGGDKRHYQITAPIQKGNSGGPVTDASGNVVGVVVSKLGTLKSGDVPQNVNFAIKSDLARQFLQDNRVQPETARSSKTMSPADVGDMVRKVTTLVQCDN